MTSEPAVKDRQPANAAALALWSARGVIWSIAVTATLSIVWGFTTLATVNARLQALELGNATAAVQRAEDRDSISKIMDRIDAANDDIRGRLRSLESQLARLTALMEQSNANENENENEKGLGGLGNTGDDTSAVSATPDCYPGRDGCW